MRFVHAWKLQFWTYTTGKADDSWQLALSTTLNRKNREINKRTSISFYK